MFIWLLNAIGISSLLVWISIGFISLRFRQAYKAQGLSLSDLPYQQPLYPLLPIGVPVLGTLMFIAVGYASPHDNVKVPPGTFKDPTRTSCTNSATQ